MILPGHKENLYGIDYQCNADIDEWLYIASEWAAPAPFVFGIRRKDDFTRAVDSIRNQESKSGEDK
jgi:hypothetical protein